MIYQIIISFPYDSKYGFIFKSEAIWLYPVPHKAYSHFHKWGKGAKKRGKTY